MRRKRLNVLQKQIAEEEVKGNEQNQGETVVSKNRVVQSKKGTETGLVNTTNEGASALITVEFDGKKSESMVVLMLYLEKYFVE